MPAMEGFRYRANIRHFFVSLYFSGRFFFEDGGLGRKNGRMDEKKWGICLEVREIVRIFAAVK